MYTRAVLWFVVAFAGIGLAGIGLVQWNLRAEANERESQLLEAMWSSAETLFDQSTGAYSGYPEKLAAPPDHINPWTGAAVRVVPIDQPSLGDIAYLPRMNEKIYENGEFVREIDHWHLIGFSDEPLVGGMYQPEADTLLALLGPFIEVDSGFGNKRGPHPGKLQGPIAVVSRLESVAEALRREGYEKLADEVQRAMEARYEHPEPKSFEEHWDELALRSLHSGGTPEVLGGLLKAGVDVDRLIDGRTALQQAAVWLNYDRARWLLEHGADPNLRDEQGRTSLDYARMATTRMQGRGTDMVASVYATDADREHMIALLREFGAEE